MFTYKMSKPSKQAKDNAIAAYRKPRAPKRKGAVIVEVCFIFPFLVWITFSIIQYGYIFWKQIQLTNLSRDAMRYLSCTGEDTSNIGRTSLYGANVSTGSPLSVRYYVAQQCQGTGISSSDLTVTITNYGHTAASASGTAIASGETDTTKLPIPGDRVAVTLSYNMNTTNTIFLAPLVPGASMYEKSIQKTTQMIMEYNLG